MQEIMDLAIVGSGISGLSCALALKDSSPVIYPGKLGGHSRTITAEQVAVDTGFIVFNKRNYPNLTALFDYLQLEIAPSNMSFGVTSAKLEYGTNSLAGLFASKTNLFQPKFHKMLIDILRFNRKAKAYVAQNPAATTAELLTDLKLGEYFTNNYLLAMAAAIWSSPKQKILQFPAATLIKFFDNHGLLTVNEQPQWYTVKGGSQVYVQKIIAELGEKVLQGRAVVALARKPNGIEITDNTGARQIYRQVIMACHSDQALQLLQAPTAAEQAILGAIKYQANKIIVHKDINFMPKRRSAWASWVYLGDQSQLSLTYWMNNLQPLATTQPILVTLNPKTKPDPNLILDEHEFMHPVFDHAAIAAQKRLSEIQGYGGLWFCGAWQGYGFHEDGIASAVRVVESIGGQVPWK